MANTLSARVIHMHDVDANWKKLPTFIPKQGEVIVYYPDETHTYPRFKIGDGKTPITQLPFLVNPHTHEFTGVEGKATASYTPTGSVSVTSTPKGTISKVVTTATPETEEVMVATTEGTSDTYKPGSCTFPALKANESEGTLTLDVNGGSFTPGEFTEGAKPTLTKVSFVKSIVITTSAPTFTGTEETIDGTFTGTQSTIESTFTPEGTIGESK